MAKGSENLTPGGEAGRLIPPAILTDMRWVSKHPDAPTESPMRIRLQEMFRNDFKKFVEMLRKDEAEWLAKKEQKTQKGPDAVDESSERIKGLIGQILEKASEASRAP